LIFGNTAQSEEPKIRLLAFFRLGLSSLLAAVLLPVLLPPAMAHDPSAWGGMFRSRDQGDTWFPVDAGLFVGGALAVAVDPQDPNHLLYGTDTRLLRSTNGGRDWAQEPGLQFANAVNALCMHKGGAVAASSGGISFAGPDKIWINAQVPAGAMPVRALVCDETRVYLGADGGVFSGEEGGRNWQRISDGLPDAPVVSLLKVARAVDVLLAVVQDRVWISLDQGRSWKPRGTPAGRIEILFYDGRLWLVGDGRVYASDDLGVTWSAVGNPFPQRDTTVRGMALAQGGKVILLATHRGLLRSVDAGETWMQMEGNLPVHLEAGPLIRDPQDAATLYVGFSLTPYAEIYRRMEGGANLLARLDAVSLAGGAAFLTLLGVLGGLGVRWLIRKRA
jgi:photosystem II stability/assembly factor-like uncharacterized protein